MDGAEVRNLGQDLSQLGRILSEVLARFGWYLLAAAFTVYLLVQHLRRRRRSQDPLTPQDTGPGSGASLVARREGHMEAARRKMQEALDAKAAIFKQKQKRVRSQGGSKSSKEAASSLSASSSSASSSSEAQKPKTDKKPLRRNDYNPLAGQGGGSCSLRPGRREPSAGG